MNVDQASSANVSRAPSLSTDARGDRVQQLHDPVSGDAESGRGLRIVEAYAERWGVEAAAAGGKTVWAEMTPDRGDA